MQTLCHKIPFWCVPKLFAIRAYINILFKVGLNYCTAKMKILMTAFFLLVKRLRIEDFSKHTNINCKSEWYSSIIFLQVPVPTGDSQNTYFITSYYVSITISNITIYCSVTISKLNSDGSENQEPNLSKIFEIRVKTDLCDLNWYPMRSFLQNMTEVDLTCRIKNKMKQNISNETYQ